MSFPVAALSPRALLRPLLTLSILVLGLVALSPPPAHAFESRAFGDVFVGPGETEPEVSTAVGDVKVEGFVEGDVHSARGDIEVGGKGVGGDVNAGMGDIEVHAPVGGEIDAGFGDVYVDAPVRGDVNVGRGDLELGPEARVYGDVTSGSGEISQNPEAVIDGKLITGMRPGMDHDWGWFGILDVVGWLFASAVFAACSVLVAVLAPRPLSAAAQKAEESPAMSLLFGVASVPAVVVLCVVLAVSIIGIPLLLLLAPAYLALVFFGALVAAFFVGRRVVLATGRYHVGNAMAAAVGAIILAAAYLIPVLGDIFLYGFALFGAGASVLALVSRRRSRTYPNYGYFGDRHDA
jgi:cytoskeletal protein CcmA (bactofilin family)